MAEAILNDVHASSMFDLRGVVAVVTGGGSVSYLPLCPVMIGTRAWTADLCCAL